MDDNEVEMLDKMISLIMQMSEIHVDFIAHQAWFAAISYNVDGAPYQGHNFAFHFWDTLINLVPVYLRLLYSIFERYYYYQ
jgi:hypothetical protein